MKKLLSIFGFAVLLSGAAMAQTQSVVTDRNGTLVQPNATTFYNQNPPPGATDALAFHKTSTTNFTLSGVTADQFFAANRPSQFYSTADSTVAIDLQNRTLRHGDSSVHTALDWSTNDRFQIEGSSGFTFYGQQYPSSPFGGSWMQGLSMRLSKVGQMGELILPPTSGTWYTGTSDPITFATTAAAGTIALSTNGNLYKFNGAAWAPFTTSSDVSAGYQPLDSDLTALAALTTTSYGLGFNTLADAGSGRTKLALGTVATLNTGYASGNVPILGTAGSLSLAGDVKMQSPDGKGFQIYGTSVDGSSDSSGGAIIALTHNGGGNRQIFLGDSDGIGLRVLGNSIDGLYYPTGTRLDLTLGTSTTDIHVARNLFAGGGIDSVSGYTINGNELADADGYLYGDISNCTNMPPPAGLYLPLGASIELGSLSSHISYDSDTFGTGTLYLQDSTGTYTALLSAPNTLGAMNGAALAALPGLAISPDTGGGGYLFIQPNFQLFNDSLTAGINSNGFSGDGSQIYNLTPSNLAPGYAAGVNVSGADYSTNSENATFAQFGTYSQDGYVLDSLFDGSGNSYVSNITVTAGGDVDLSSANLYSPHDITGTGYINFNIGSTSILGIGGTGIVAYSALFPGGAYDLGTTGAGHQWARLYIDNTVTASGSTGAKTINKERGTVRFAAGASSVVVTDSFVSSTSKVIAQGVGAFDSTAKNFQCAASSGSFTIYANAAATAETEVYFSIEIH